MDKSKLFIVEQYFSWKGHYKQYFENLLSEKYSYIYCAKIKENYPNSIFLSASYKEGETKSFLNFIKGRLFDSFTTYSHLISQKPVAAHLIEFEPFSFLYLLLFKRKEIPHLIITVHSIDRMNYNNKIKDLISWVQRKVYQYSLRQASSLGATFVTHYKHHKRQLNLLLGENYNSPIVIINYPCPERFNNHLQKKSINKRFLIYGQIREDKGIFEFLSNPETQALNITIAGKIHDERILKFNYPNLKIINKFISEEELPELIDTHSFMLLPYHENYTGGAGTLKDSLSYGLPVIASDIPIFQEIIQGEQVGFIFKSVHDINAFADGINEKDYFALQKKCSDYAQKYNWEYMRNEYFNLYENILGQV